MKLNSDEYSITINEIMTMVKKRWIVIILCIVAVASFLPTYKYVKDKQVQQLQMEANEMLAEEIVLEEEDLLRVNEYLLEMQLLANMKEEKNESIFLSLDPYNVPVNDLRLMLHNNSKMSTDDILDIYSLYVNGGGLATWLESRLDYAYEAKYLQEIIHATYVSKTGENDRGTGVIHIRILGIDEQFCRDIKMLLVERLNEFENEIINEVGDHAISFIYDELAVLKVENVLTTREKYDENLKKQETKMDELYNTLSYEQRLYIDREINPDEISEQVVSVVSFSWKYFVVGIFVGVLVGIAIVLAEFILSNKINTVNEFGRIYNIDVLDIIKKENVDVKNLNSDFCMIKVAKICECNDINDVTLCCVDGDIKQSLLLKNIESYLNENNVHCNVTSDVLEKTENISQFRKNSNVIFVEKLYETKKKDFALKLDLCNKLNNRILGAIVIQ